MWSKWELFLAVTVVTWVFAISDTISESQNACEDSYCNTEVGNLIVGRESNLSASSTCGLYQTDKYCIVSGYGKECFWCDSRPFIDKNSKLSHGVANIASKNSRSWWQSRNGVEDVSLQLDLEAELYFSSIELVFKTHYPAAIVIERSFDFGKAWRAYRYFANNCDEAFPGIPERTPKSLSDVVCESNNSPETSWDDMKFEFRPLPQNFDVNNIYSQEVQNLLKMTNLRVKFTRFSTIDNSPYENPFEIQEKYYYAVSEMTVNGSCMCFGHASHCKPRNGTKSTTDMVHSQCVCQHNTKGLNCEYCEDFYYDQPWRPASVNSANACIRCTCHNHSTSCHFDSDVYNSTSGISGGVCDDCQHNTTGRNCERCKVLHHRNPNLGLEHPEVCVPCNCDIGGSLDNECNVITGQCKCRPNMWGLRCDVPAPGFFVAALDNLIYEAELSDCSTRPREKSTNGNCRVIMMEGREVSWTGVGFMKFFEDDEFEFIVDDIPMSMDYDIVIRYEPQVPGDWEEVIVHVERLGPLGSATQCADIDLKYDTMPVILPYAYKNVTVDAPVCLEAGKTYKMVIKFGKHASQASNPTVNILIDSVTLRPKVTSLPFFNNATPVVEAWRKGYVQSVCGDNYNSTTNNVIVPNVCKQYYKSIGLHVFNGAQMCQCDPIGSENNICEEYGGKCHCKNNVAGKTCNRCAPGYYRLGSTGCKPCNCNGNGSLDNFCDVRSGQCNCKQNTYSRKCEKCKFGYWNFPNCHQCKCNSQADSCDPQTGTCTSCRNFTQGDRCESCKEGYYRDPRLGYDTPCIVCPCPVTLNSTNFFAPRCKWNPVTRNVTCECQKGYTGSRCDACADNYYGHPEKPGGSCVECNCSGNIDITQPRNCDRHTGKCLQCLNNTDGDNCEVCKPGFFGNALKNNCTKCSCEILGTNSTMGACDRESGQCFCYENVTGLRCDRCQKNYWRLESGKGCDPCQCDPDGSYGKMCNVKNGQCICKRGFGGIRCNQCPENSWGNPKHECQPCECDSLEHTSEKGCNHTTGACICKEGIGGPKCDTCARGYLGPFPNCTPCGECFDKWDPIIAGLKNKTDFLNNTKITPAKNYTADLKEMEGMLKSIDDIVNGTTQIGEMKNKTAAVKIQFLNANNSLHNATLANVASKVKSMNASMEDALKKLEKLKDDTEGFILDAAKLQGSEKSNVTDSLKLIKDAEKKARDAVKDADKSQKSVDKIGRINDRIAEFNRTQKENNGTIKELQKLLKDMKSQMPKLNGKMCGKNSSKCDGCGGAGCGTCGGPSCDQGAVPKVDKALELTNAINASVEELEKAIVDLSSNVSKTKNDTKVALKANQEAYDAALAAKNSTDALKKDGNAEINRLSSNFKNNTAMFRGLVNDILKINMNVSKDDVENLIKDLNSSLSQITGVEDIIKDTKKDLKKINELKERAVSAKKNATAAMERVPSVEAMVNNSHSAQKLAEEAFNKLFEDNNSTLRDLQLIEGQRNETEKRTKELLERMEKFTERLEALKKINFSEPATEQPENFTDLIKKLELDVEQLKNDYEDALKDIEIRDNNQKRSQLIQDKVKQVNQETLKQLEELEALKKDTDLLNSKKNATLLIIDGLNSEVARYYENITNTFNSYKDCSHNPNTKTKQG